MILCDKNWEHIYGDNTGTLQSIENVMFTAILACVQCLSLKSLKVKGGVVFISLNLPRKLWRRNLKVTLLDTETYYTAYPTDVLMVLLQLLFWSSDLNPISNKEF